MAALLPFAHRIGRFLEREGLLERDAENSYLAPDAVPAGSMDNLWGHSITYRIAVGPQAGRKVFTLQTLPAYDVEVSHSGAAGQVTGFSPHAGVAAWANELEKLERLCRYIILVGNIDVETCRKCGCAIRDVNRKLQI